MARTPVDTSLDALLDLDGLVLVVDACGGHWVKFDVVRVPVSPERPHGLSYSLSLHAANGDRLAGFDNAHSVASGSGPGKKRRAAHDHKHRLRTIRPYEYRDAATLLQDFWTDVDAVLREKGVIQ